ncbi:putative Mg2+ transporter-C (MgtC) family protein [Williamsia sterculiae]|uniref:Putative Mg2+ transporter-C (MgtC) family protein n=1 Tax=Williamsia sterculiae TaxID=1344003 RepID=A0A1N7F2R3_9NOCA|nr:putative Mg2+ transporter-C (MgtC) family protein [Williamsia sterculiae]
MVTQLLADAPGGQLSRQLIELLVAFGLSSAIGLERQFRGKSAGLRTQTIVGTASALLFLVSKYGFADILYNDNISLDPSRIAAQIVSGVGFLGAGLIITRRGAIRGLTTAAAVWETAAIGMAAGSGLLVLATVVTALHFVIVFVYTPIGRYIDNRAHHERTYAITYYDGRGVLRDLIASCTANAWTIRSPTILDTDHSATEPAVTVTVTLDGRNVAAAPNTIAAIDGLIRIDLSDEDDEE